MPEQKNNIGLLELVAVAALILLYWRWNIKRNTVFIPGTEPATTEREVRDQFARDPDFNLNNYCQNVVYQPLEPTDLKPATLLGKDWCYRGDRSVVDEKLGYGDDYASRQAEAYQQMKQAEAIMINNKKCIQFKLVNSGASEITTEIFDTTEDGSIMNGTYEGGGGSGASAPVIVTAIIPDDNVGITLLLTYDQDLDESSVPDPADYDVSSDNVIAVSISGSIVTLTLEDGAGPGEIRTLSYTPGTNALKSIGGIDAAALVSYAIDNQRSNDVVIGTQTWRKANVSDNIAGSKVYDDNEANRAIYGGLYTFGMIAAIEALYPGYHVPTYAEMLTLIVYCGGGAVAGGKLKETGTSHWLTPNTGATNEFNFTALPGGYHFSGSFGNINQSAIFWLSTEYNVANAYTFGMGHDYANSVEPYLPKTDYFSVRLIKD